MSATLTAKAYFQNLAEFNSAIEVLCTTIKSLLREINNNLIITISVNSSNVHTRTCKENQCSSSVPRLKAMDDG